MSLDEALLEAAIRLVHEFFADEPLCHADADGDTGAATAVADLLSIQLADLEDVDEEAIIRAVDDAVHSYRATLAPPREHAGSTILCLPDQAAVQEQLLAIRAIPQPEQRTPEWYAFRGTYLTASSAWKAFATPGALNQLIYDKCCAARGDSKLTATAPRGVNVESPLHWGQKYEPVSVMWYESEYQTTVGEFGCIPHPTIACLAASPDGINIDHRNPRYGRMLEIKNVVSREITGVPKKEYWIQMQLQMAVCGLRECDFLETKFREYENEEDWRLDGDRRRSAAGNMKGKIIQFMVDGAPAYEYQPLDLDCAGSEAWERAAHDAHAMDTWIRDTYWELEVVSCVLVEHNPEWMRAAESRLRDVWRIIELERRLGFEHRAPQKRKDPDQNNARGETADGSAHAAKCMLIPDGANGFKADPTAVLPTLAHPVLGPAAGGPVTDVHVVTSPLGRIGSSRSS